LKKGNYANRVSKKASVFVAGVLEYLTHELVDLAGRVARDNKKARISRK
jgi:hypothetical protein